MTKSTAPRSTLLTNDEDVFKTAMMQFSADSSAVKPSGANSTSPFAAAGVVSEDEGFHTGVPDDEEVFYTAKSDFFTTAKRAHLGDNSCLKSTTASHVAQLCSPDKRIAGRMGEMASAQRRSTASVTGDRGRQSSSLPRQSSGTTKNYGGEPAKDLKAESEKWMMEAERWRRKLEEQCRTEV